MGYSLKVIMAMLIIPAMLSAQQRPLVGPITILAPSPGLPPLKIEAAAGQTSDLLQTVNSSGAVHTLVNAIGTLQGPFQLPGSTPNRLLYADGSGMLLSATPFVFTPSNGYVGISVANPTAPFHVGADTLFAQNVNVLDGGFGTFTYGEFRPSQGVINWNAAHSRIGSSLSARGIVTDGSANEWGLHIAVTTEPTSSAGSYEKAGLFIYAETLDTSNGTTTTRDIVGADIRGVINGGIATGRAWGINPWCSVNSGSDGLCTGIEIDLNNNGSQQDALNTTTGKAGFLLASIGANPATVAQAIVSSANQGNAWKRGLWSDQDYLLAGGSFIELGVSGDVTCDLWRVKPTGQTLVGHLCNNSSLNDYDATVYGQLNVSTYMTVLGGGSLAAEKHAFYILSDSSVSKHRLGTTRYDNSVSFWPLTLETGGLEALLATIDPFVQFTASYAGGNVSAAGTAALRNHAGVLEVSQNGGAWAAIASGSGSLPDCSEAGQVVKCLISGNAATYLQVENDTSGTAAQAALVAQNGNGGTQNIIVGSTSAGFTPINAIPANAGYVFTGSGNTGGLYIVTSAGDVRFYPTSDTVSENNDRNAASYLAVKNKTNGNAAQAVVFVESDQASGKAYLGTTSSTFSTTNGIPLKAGYISSDTQNTGGLYIQTRAGSMHFQVGTTDKCTLDSSGLMSCTTFNGSGSQLTNLVATNLTGVVPIANGGTNSSTFTSGRIPYFDGSALVSSVAAQSGGAIHIVSGSVNIDTNNQGLVMGGSSISADQGNSVTIVAGSSTTGLLVDTNSDSVCVRFGGNLRRLSLSGGNVIDGGAC